MEWQVIIKQILESLESLLGPHGMDNVELIGNSVNVAYRYWHNGMYLASNPHVEDDDNAVLTANGRANIVALIEDRMARYKLDPNEFGIYLASHEKWWYGVTISKKKLLRESDRLTQM